MIVFDGETLAPKSGMAGTLYASEMDFNLWCVSSNFRGEYQATIGSAVSAEASATADPGANRIVGDLNANIHAQILGTAAEVGYLLMDVDQDVADQVCAGLRALPTTLRARKL